MSPRFLLLWMALISPMWGQTHSLKYPPSPKHRQVVLQVISSGKGVGKIVWSEETLAEAAYWYDKGDHETLNPLLDAAGHCDGATAEFMGSWLGETFIAQPLTILKAVSVRPRVKQEQLGFLAVMADGSGHEPKKMAQIRKLLSKYSNHPDSRISEAAQCWLLVLDKFESDQKNQL